MAHAQNRAIWIATGNNVAMSRELVRRTIWIRINARVERPSERTGYRHPRLLDWVEENRQSLVQAALTLIQAWIHRGRPHGSQTMGMFEDWVTVLGGILDVAGVPGLLENRPQFQQQQQGAHDDWPAFLQAWWDRIGTQPVGVAQLYQLANDGQYLDEVLGDGGPRSQRSLMGRRLTKMVDRVVGEWRIESAGQDRSNRQLYRLHWCLAKHLVT
jgi:putative DNA primase/helicase